MAPLAYACLRPWYMDIRTRTSAVACFISAFSKIAENTALISEVLLRQPTISHRLFKKRLDWFAWARWMVGFMNESAVYESREQKLLYLVSV